MLKLGLSKSTSEEYNSDKDHLRNSHLNDFEKAPRVHYWNNILGEKEDDETPSKLFGRQFHEAILEPYIFDQKYFTDLHIYEKFPNRTKKDYKDAFKDFAKIHEGKEMIKAKEWENIIGMRGALEDAIASKVLSLGEPEMTLTWPDPDTGLRLKARPDFMTERHIPDGRKIRIIIDVKTTEDASIEKFPYSAWKYKYYRQAAWYLNGATVVTGIPHTSFVIIAIEKNPPWLYKVYQVHESWIWAGQKEIKELLAKYKTCVDSNLWPGLPNEDNVEFLNAPEAYVRQFQELEEG